MKVCYLNHDLKDNTGAGRFGLQFTGHFLKAYPGIRYVVLTASGSGNRDEKAILFPRALRLLFALPRIRVIFKDYDIIHALDGYPYGIIAAFASVGLRKKLIITAVGTGALQALRRPIMGWFLRWAYRRADRVIAVSDYTKREILRECPGVDILVIGHGVDVKEFLGNPGEGLLENEKLEIKKLKPYVLSVGSGKPRKGYAYSFPAFAAIEKKIPGLRYVTVGYDKGRAPIDSLGISGKVICYNGVRRQFLKELYRNAELFLLLPYDDRGDVEGFGFAFLEAAAAGLPVVGTYGCGAEDAVDKGVNGFLVEPKNSVSAAEAAITIFATSGLRERFSKNSVEFAKRMSWDKVTEKYSEIYRQLMANN